MGTLQEQQRKFDESVAYIENLRTSEGNIMLRMVYVEDSRIMYNIHRSCL